MTTTTFCSDRAHHAAFGWHERTIEGLYCRECGLPEPAPSTSGSEAGEGTEVNMPSLDQPLPLPPSVDAIPAGTSTDTPAPAAPPAPSGAPAGRRVCPNCGSRFDPRRADQVWCLPTCRKAAWKRRDYAKERLKAGLTYHPRIPMRSRGVFKALLEEEEADR